MKGTESPIQDKPKEEHAKIHIIGVPGEEQKKKGTEKIYEGIIVENFPNMRKEIVNQVQEAQRVPYRINPRINMPRDRKSVV